MTQFTDIEIIEILQKREQDSLNAVLAQLYSQNKKKISQMVLKEGGNEKEGEDLLLEVINIFLENVVNGKFVLRPNRKISAYLFEVAKSRRMQKDLRLKSRHKYNWFEENEENSILVEPDTMQQMIEKEKKNRF